jgi:hypothetical protein
LAAARADWEATTCTGAEAVAAAMAWNSATASLMKSSRNKRRSPVAYQTK